MSKSPLIYRVSTCEKSSRTPSFGADKRSPDSRHLVTMLRNVTLQKEASASAMAATSTATRSMCLRVRVPQGNTPHDKDQLMAAVRSTRWCSRSARTVRGFNSTIARPYM